MKNKYTNLKKEDIEKEITSYFESIDKDDDTKPDIVIETAKPSYFACSIYTDNHTLTTGIGGFKMFLKELPGLELFKVSFNGIILNQKEKQELYAKYR